MIIKLQEALAHQGEDMVRLSEELYTQQKEIAQLRSQVTRLQAKLQAAVEEGSVVRSIDQETPPPHY